MTYREQEKLNAEKSKNNKKGKGTIAILVAASLAATCTVACFQACSRKNSDDNENKNGANEKPSFEYVLYQPTDMNSEEELNKLLDSANNVAGKDLDKDIIRYFNHSELKEGNRLTRNDYKNMSDEEIADTVYDYPIEYYDWMDSKTVDNLINVKAEVLAGETVSSLDTESSYKILTPFVTTDKNSYLYQTYQTEYDTVLDDEIEDIIDGNTQDFIKNAKAFYDVVKKIMDDPKVSSNQNLKAMFLEGAKDNYRYFASILKAEYPDYYKWLEKEFQNNSLNSWGGTFLDYLGVVLDAEACAKKIKNYEKYDASDAELAKAYTKAVQDGKVPSTKTSNDVKHKQEVESRGTTSVTESTTIHKVPESEQQKAETTTEKTGGKPVGTTSKKEETTRVVKEEDVKPETTKPTTTSSSEEDFAPGYVDADGTLWMDENEWQKVK